LIEEIKNYLQVTADFAKEHHNNDWPYSCISDFILKNGKAYKLHYSAKFLPQGRMGECFRNALHFVERGGKDFKYVEGYAFSVCIPMMHAWAAEGNHVFDPTWKDGQAYFGVEFPLSYVRKVIFQREKWGVIDAWDIGFPLLTGKHEYPIKGGD